MFSQSNATYLTSKQSLESCYYSIDSESKINSELQITNSNVKLNKNFDSDGPFVSFSKMFESLKK